MSEQSLTSLAVIVGALLIGFFIQNILLRRLKKFAEKTAWKGDDVVISSLHGMIPLWCALVAVSFTLSNFELSSRLTGILEKSLLVVMIFSLTVVVARIASGLIRIYGSKEESGVTSASILVNVTRLLVFILGGLIILQTLGIEITPILTALGVGGLAVALALQETLSNLFAGIHILASKKIQPGNFVRLESGEEGYVVDITWRNTTIRVLPNNLVIVPNAKLASSVVVNYYLPDTELAVLVDVGVSYKSNLELVERVTIDVGKEVMTEVNGGVPAFMPFIRYHTFGDSSINFTVILRGKEFVDQYLIKHEFIKRLHTRYATEGIEIPFPQRDLHIIENGSPRDDVGSATASSRRNTDPSFGQIKNSDVSQRKG